MAVTAYQVNYNGDSNGYVPAIADRRLYNSLMAVSNSAGFVKEPTITVSGLNVTVTNGWGIIYGCEFLIDNEVVSVSGVAGTYLLILRLNVTTSAAELVFVDSSTSLVQEDINNGGSIYEMAILQCVNNGSSITEHTVQYTVLNTNSAAITGLRSDISALESSVSSLQTAVSGKTNTKVKGNAESSFRTGNVNLTPANIGAVPTTRKINNIALTSDVDLTAYDVNAVVAERTNIASGTLISALNTYWGTLDTDTPYFGMLEADSSTNTRYLVGAWKVSSTTGLLVLFDFKATNSKAMMRVFLRSSGTFTEYDFTSD